MDSFYDLDVSETAKLPDIVERLVENHYHWIAVSKQVDASELNFTEEEEGTEKGNKRERRQKMRKSIRERLCPPSLDGLVSDVAKSWAQSRGKKVTMLSRLTLVCGASVQMKQFLREFQSDVNKFDLLAVQPTSEEAFSYVCEEMPVDIITTNLNQKPDFKLNFKMVKLAVNRGLQFEVKLAPMLASSQCRTYTVSFLSDLVGSCRGRNVIISSGASDPWDARNSLGVAAVARMFGIPAHLATHCQRENCQNALEHALVRRKSVLGAMAISQLKKMPGVREIEVVPSNGCTVPVADTGDSSDVTPAKKRRIK